MKYGYDTILDRAIVMFRNKFVLSDSNVIHMNTKVILGVHINYIAIRQQELVSEHNNCTVKDRIISIFHSIPFTMIPNLMGKKVNTIETKRLNWFPAKGNVFTLL